MTPRVFLALSLMFVLLCCGVWDLVLTAKDQPQNTVSATLLEWSVQFPMLPVVVGILIGHLFWPQKVRL